ncbi:MAG: hypothetical protein ACRD44_05235 [Bryobacteraceae bacterium]
MMTTSWVSLVVILAAVAAAAFLIGRRRSSNFIDGEHPDAWLQRLRPAAESGMAKTLSDRNLWHRIDTPLSVGGERLRSLSHSAGQEMFKGERVFLVIEGPAGGGKSVLAYDLAWRGTWEHVSVRPRAAHPMIPVILNEAVLARRPQPLLALVESELRALVKDQPVLNHTQPRGIGSRSRSLLAASRAERSTQ